MIRKIIKIDENKCNGCGACAAACHEGAIEMIGGKAISEAPEPSVGTIAYGYVTSDKIQSVTEITSAMLEQSTIRQVEASALDKTSLGTIPAGAWVVVLVPEGYHANSHPLPVRGCVSRKELWLNTLNNR